MLGLLKRVKTKNNYAEQGDIEVEIFHYHSIKKSTEMLQKTTTYNYSKYPFVINRPANGKTVIDHNCQICHEPLKIRVRSKKLLMKIINPSLIMFAVAIVLVLILVLFYGNLKGTAFEVIGGMTAMVLFVISVMGFIFALPMEYTNKGISDIVTAKFWDGATETHQRHVVNQSPINEDKS